MNEEVKQETSVPVQSRVSIVRLAEMAKYFESQGHKIRNMSQLLSWSMELLCEILRSNEQIGEEMKVAEAHGILTMLDLYQASLKTRSFKKISTAIRFEGMREEGIDPRAECPTHYNILHNKQSVEPANIRVESRSKYEEEWQKAKIAKQQEIYDKAREEARKAQQPGNLREGASKEELERKMAEIEERDRLRAEEFKKADLLFTGDDK